MGLPFLLLVAFLLPSGVNCEAKEEAVLAFQQVESTCIDLAHYNAKAKQLTVRYVDRDTDRFYRYSKVPGSIWKKLLQLNQTGGVGNYFVSTIQQHPEEYPFEKILILKFKVIPKKKRAGDSK